jgi:hypothetical protein
MRNGRRDPGSTHWTRLGDFLRTDSDDPGCTACRLDLDRYAQLVVDGKPAAAHFPAVAAHLASCADCRDDLTGLTAALSCGAD